MMTTVTIPGNTIRCERDVHEVLAAALSFGRYYGWNLDALWDRLTVDVERPLHLVWADASTSRAQLGDEVFERIVNVLRAIERNDSEAGYSDRLTVEVNE